AIRIPCFLARLNSGSYADGVIGTAISASYDFCAIACVIRSSTNWSFTCSPVGPWEMLLIPSLLVSAAKHLLAVPQSGYAGSGLAKKMALIGREAAPLEASAAAPDETAIAASATV